MSSAGLEQFGAYEKARRLFHLVVTDMQALKFDNRCFRLVAQQDSRKKYEEGYGRLSKSTGG